MPSINAEDLVRQAYSEYGSYVNNFRALPDIRDGLKPVQRRILLSASDSGSLSKVVKSAVVVSGTTGSYHPHGESSVYNAMVKMVNHQVPMFTPQGNFGLRSYVSAPPAAMRYTGVQLKNVASSIYLAHRKYAPEYKNELHVSEPHFLPTSVPYCLLNGCIGIGIAVRTHIPPVTLISLKKAIKFYLMGKSMPLLSPSPPGGMGWIEMEPSEVMSLNYLGHGTATIGAHVSWEFDENDRTYSICVSDAPEGLSYGRIKASLEIDNLISDGYVRIRNASTSSTKILIRRTKNTRRINDEDLFERVKSSMKRQISFQCVVSDNGVAKKVGIRKILQTAINHDVKAYTQKVQENLDEIDYEKKFFFIRKHLVDALISDIPFKDILKLEAVSSYDVSEEELKRMLRKSISALQRGTASVQELNEKEQTLKKLLESPEISYLKSGIDLGGL